VYVISADGAENVPDGDYSCGHVWKVGNREQCAMWHGRTDPDTFGHVLGELGRYYNTALIAPEANAAGLATLHVLAKDLSYPRLFYREHPQTHKVNFDKPGFYTTGGRDGGLRARILIGLACHVRDASFIPHSPELIHECRGIQLDYTEHGYKRYAAAPGKHDDIVIGGAIGLWIIDHSAQCPRPVPVEEYEKKARRYVVPFPEEEEPAWIVNG